MKDTPRDELAWTDELLARLSPTPPLSPAQVARIRATIDLPRRSAGRLGLLAAAAILLTGSIAFGVAWLVRPAPEVAPAAPSPSLSSSPSLPSSPPPPSPPPSSPPAPVPVAPPAPTARIERIETQGPPRRVAHAVPEPIEPPPPASPGDTSTLGAESQLLASVLHELRTDHDPHGALAALDRYAAEFPHGVLATEATTARIEALLATGDRRSALALLDAIAVGSELAALRGELRLEAGRLDDAERDFTAALLGADDSIEQRALFGRAAARTRLGDRRGARADLEAYLARFPRSGAADAARTALERLR